MKPLLLLGIVYCLGGASYPLLAWLLGYRRRMREQKREALLNRVIGATPRKTEMQCAGGSD